MQRILAWGAFIVVILGLLAQFVLARWPGQTAQDQFAQCRVGKLAAWGEKVGAQDFSLVDGNGKTWTRDQIMKSPSLIYFGYTFCPDVCPFDTVRNAEATDILQERGFSITPVFITIDPQRDTPQVMSEYAENMHPDMLGLSGSAAQTAQALQSFYAVASVPPDQDPEYYVVDHSTFSYLTLPNHGFVEFFRRDLTSSQMADQIACYLEKT